MKKYTVAVMGLGVRGRIHVHGLLGNPERFSLVGLCDIDQKAIDKVVQEFHLEDVPRFLDAEEMLKTVRPEIFVFVTYPDMRLNCLGLGSAATPAGLAAFRELEKLEEERRGKEKREGQNGEERKREGQKRGGQNRRGEKRGEYGRKRAAGLKYIARPKGTASNEMCTFLILNISSLQLIPVNIIAYRSQYGSSNPAAIVGPAIAATFASTLAAVVFCKVMDRAG